MKLHCPDCGTLIPAEQVDVGTGLAKCVDCDAVFSLSDRLELQRQVQGQPRAGKPAIVPRPPRIHIEQFAGTWRATWRWYHWHHLPLLFFCIAWDGFLIFWYTMAFREDAPWIMIVFPVGHLAVGVGLTYSLIAGFLNRTRIELAFGQLTVRHGPVPWWGSRSLPTAQIQQLHCEHGNAHRNNSVSYRLCATLKDGRKITLASGFYSNDEPRFLEHELESRLRIAPRAVAGECA